MLENKIYCFDCKYQILDDNPCKWCIEGSLLNPKTREQENIDRFRQIKFLEENGGIRK